VVKAVALVAVMIGGCSFATMQTPHGSPPECTESQLAPIVDIGLAVAAPFFVYGLAKSSDTSPQQDDVGPAITTFLLGVPMMAVFGTSAIYGFIKADRCSRVKRDYQQLMAAPPGPGPYAPPPVAPGPYAPGPYAPGPYAPGPYAPAPMPGPPPAPPMQR
jgi:hypothetical protein